MMTMVCDDTASVMANLRDKEFADYRRAPWRNATGLFFLRRAQAMRRSPRETSFAPAE